MLLAACGPKATPTEPATVAPAQEAKTEATKAPEPTAVPEPTKAERLKFSYLRPVWLPATHEEGAAYELELFERANVEIESQIVPVVDYETKFPVMVAGGTMADLMWHAGPHWGPAHDLIEQGAFLPLNEQLEKHPEVRDAIGSSLWNLTKSPDGNNYFFPMPLAPYVPFPIQYRADLYDQLGFAVPQTIEEFVEQLREMKTKLPDMIPFTADAHAIWAFQNVATAFGYPWGNWIPAEGEPEDNPAKIVPGHVTPGYRDFLAFLQMLSKEELGDPDWLLNTAIGGGDKFRAGKVVVTVGHWMSLPDHNMELRKVVPEGDVSYMPQLMGTALPMGALTLQGFDRGFSISTQAADKLDGIFNFLQWVYTEGYDFMRYGVEGETYRVEADGTKVSIPDNERKSGYVSTNMEPFGFPPKTVDTWPNWKEITTTLAARGVPEKLGETVVQYKTSADNAMPNWNHLTYSPTAGEKGAQLSEQYITPMQEKLAIDPEAPLTLWDEAIKNWLGSGGQTIIDEVNEIQTDKSPIKPVYEVPDDYKQYLE